MQGKVQFATPTLLGHHTTVDETLSGIHLLPDVGPHRGSPACDISD